MCDASAAVSVDSARFIVANDEDNILRVYRNDQPGKADFYFDLNEYLAIEHDDKNPEIDIEGATNCMGKIYWISSHGRNKSGLFRPNRYRLFATAINGKGDNLDLKVTGTVYKNLVHDLMEDNRFRQLNIFIASMLDTLKNKDLAPDKNGINIEGLSVTADGQSLLIAFRNPRPQKKALIITLKNPEAVILHQTKPDFGDPILLDLEGLGIRSIEYVKQISAYLIIAGSHDDKRIAVLYQWKGGENDPPIRRKETLFFHDLVDFNPESLIIYPGRKEIQILSDDGDIPIANGKNKRKKSKKEGYRCKDVADPGMKQFRSIWLDLY
jgi:hypothetical protein